MAEVATRHAQGGVLHDVKKNTSSGFDVRSWKGLTEILKAARTSAMDAVEYAAFRDTVLAYAQSGGSDAGLRKSIEGTAAKFKVRLEPETAAQKAAEPERVSHSGTSRPFAGLVRPTPRFRGPAPSATTAPEMKSAQKSVSEPAVSLARRYADVPENLPTAQASATDVPDSIKPKAEPKAEQEVVSVPVKKISDTSGMAAATPQHTVAGIKTIEEYKARIAEIKRTVNAHVGNPITLMDGENAIGREYMQALLAAMKAVSGAAPGTLQSSMDQLEKVFARVSALPGAKKEDTNPSIAENVSEVKQETKPEPVSHVPQTTTQPMSKLRELRSSAPSVENRNTATNEVARAPIASVTSQDHRQSSAPIAGTRAPQVPVRHDSAPAVQPSPSVVIPKSETTPAPQPKIPDQSLPRVPQSKPSPKSTSSATHGIPSLADALKKAGVEETHRAHESVPPKETPSTQVTVAVPRPQSSAPQASSAVPVKQMPNVLKVGDTSPAVSAMGKHAAKGVGRSAVDTSARAEGGPTVPHGVRDDLHAPEVDEGLKQLLNEWSIFRGGGLFGTGPSGIEHPLFEKLAPLPMSIVASGTWEGAGKEAILSIRDYINGWRHEQGVSYVQTESFENYLRRVIKRILKRVGS